VRVNPPSTASACPTTKLEASLQSQRTAAATSSARPSRPIGCIFRISSMIDGIFATMSWTIGVSIVQGQTALMRMPCAATSSAALLVMPITPCFEPW
jgi:hypothetical protein